MYDEYDMIMYVYENLNYDSRVKRAVRALHRYQKMLVISSGGKRIEDWYQNIVLKKKFSGLFSYIHNLFSFFLNVNNKKCGIFYANDYYSAIPALYMCITKKCKCLVYDAHELFLPSECRLFSPLKIFLFFERFVVRKADLVICAQEQRATAMKELYRLRKEPTVIHNFSKLKIANKALSDEYQEFFKIDKTTVVYVGYLSKDRKINELIDAVADQKDRFKLVLICANVELEKLRIDIDRQGFDILYINGLPHDELGDVLKKCDIGYIAYSNDTLNNRYCSPNKIYEYMSAGLAILANKNEGLEHLLDRFNVGVSTDDYAHGLQCLAQNIEIFKRNSCGVDVDKLMETDFDKLDRSILVLDSNFLRDSQD